MAKTSTNLDAEQPTNQEAWLRNMRSKYPDVENDDELYGKSMEGYDREHDYAKRSRAENQRMAEIMNENPDLASFYKEVYTRGKDGHPEMALLNLGDLLKSYINGDLTSDEYIKGKEAKSKKDSETKAKIAKMDEVFQKWCQEKGYNPEEWMQKATELLFDPIQKHEIAEAQLEAIDHMINYDNDVAAAETRGRNENISAQRIKGAKLSDGMLNTTSASASATPQRKESAISSIAKQREFERSL